MAWPNGPVLVPVPQRANARQNARRMLKAAWPTRPSRPTPKVLRGRPMTPRTLPIRLLDYFSARFVCGRSFPRRQYIEVQVPPLAFPPRAAAPNSPPRTAFEFHTQGKLEGRSPTGKLLWGRARAKSFVPVPFSPWTKGRTRQRPHWAMCARPVEFRGRGLEILPRALGQSPALGQRWLVSPTTSTA